MEEIVRISAKVMNKKTVGRWLAGLAFLLFASQAWAFTIMLSNDDGCNAPGINVLANELESRGYNVTMYAPASNQSGQGSRIIVPGGGYIAQYTVTNKDLAGKTTKASDRHCVAAKLKANGSAGADLPPPFTSANETVSASPSESVVVGLKAMNPEPDLVVSGINSAANSGVLTLYSGTVAAAVTALRLDVPAIATSKSVLQSDYQGAADFTADVVDQLVANEKNGKLLPEGIGLNINYPKDPQGVIFTRIGKASPVMLTAEKVHAGLFKTKIDLDFSAQGIPREKIHQEGIALREGYISVSPIRGSYTASRAAQSLVQLKLHGIKP